VVLSTCEQDFEAEMSSPKEEYLHKATRHIAVHVHNGELPL
jgi:hypothetical protein